MYERRLKPWVSQLVMPWIIIYCVACAASLFALGYKLHLLVKKLRARARSAAHDAAQPSWPISTRGTVNLGGLEIPQELSSNPSVRDLRKKLEDNQQKIHTLYCLFLLVAVEGACHHLPLCTVFVRQGAGTALASSLCRRADVHFLGPVSVQVSGGVHQLGQR
jgi:hypothetical protein